MPPMQPDRIGRYRLDRLLAAHAAWETFAGWDEQLDRPVLVARVPLGGVDSAVVELWRHKVRALSAVTQPGLAHVLDVLSDDGCDWVVNEWVEGEPVNVLAARQPLVGSEVVRLGGELAETLASLHRRAVLHASVHPGNVLVTPAGHVKLQGGWAPLWKDPDAARPSPPEATPSDPACLAVDLQGLGEVLLAIAGVHRGGTRTAESIAARLAATCGELATPLASVISRCLGTAKESPFASAQQAAAALRALDALSQRTTLTAGSVPGRLDEGRRRTTFVVAGVAAAMAMLAAFGWWMLRPSRPRVVGVMPVAALGASEDARLAALAVNEAVVGGLSSLPNLIVVSEREVQALAKQGRREPEIARELALDELAVIRLAPGPSATQAVLTLERKRSSDLEVTWTHSVTSGSTNPSVLAGLATDLLQGAYRGFYPTQMSRSASLRSPDYLEYLRVRDKLQTGRASPDHTAEIAALRSVVEHAPDLAEAWLALAELYRTAFLTRFDERDRAECERCLKRTRELGLSPLSVGRIEIELLLVSGETARAVEVARGLSRQASGNPFAWEMLGRVLSRSGRFEEAERAFARAAMLQPSATALFTLAAARSERGDHEGARHALAQATALQPTSLRARILKAEIEMYAGNFADAEREYRKLVADRGNRFDLTHLANCLYYQGKFEEAGELYQAVLQKEPGDFLAMANLGDTYFALGRREDERRCHEQALALVEKVLEKPVKERSALETRARCLAYLGKRTAAIEALQEALRQYPHHPATLFTAAQVSVLVEDRASAIAWTTKARQANAPRPWFEVPEFAALAQDPRFIAALGGR